MDKKWEIRQVSTSERIFDKIKEEMARPVGIVLFGADCDFKNEILDMIAGTLQRFACYYTKAPDTATLVKAVKDHLAVVIVLNSDESSTHGLRHELVKVMRNAGAETVVGIYTKVKYPHKIPTSGLSLEARQRRLAQEKCINTLEHNPPTADGLDYFIVVEEEKEG